EERQPEAQADGARLARVQGARDGPRRQHRLHLLVRSAGEGRGLPDHVDSRRGVPERAAGPLVEIPAKLRQRPDDAQPAAGREHVAKGARHAEIGRYIGWLTAPLPLTVPNTSWSPALLVFCRVFSGCCKPSGPLEP